MRFLIITNDQTGSMKNMFNETIFMSVTVTHGIANLSFEFRKSTKNLELTDAQGSKFAQKKREMPRP